LGKLGEADSNFDGIRMTDARIVANYMLDAAASRDIELTNLALQKLLFFAHAISLVERRSKLVSGYFEAWQYGPVHPAAYEAFKEAGASPIKFRARAFDPVARKTRALEPLADREAREICERVILQFGRMTAGRLVDIAHATGGAWDYVVKSAETGANIGLRIPDEVIVTRQGRLKVSVSPTPRVGEPSEDAPLLSRRAK
jgi:uncharacterized phage-associated protein